MRPEISSSKFSVTKCGIEFSPKKLRRHQNVQASKKRSSHATKMDYLTSNHEAQHVDKSQSQHILELSRELLDDIELSRLAPEQLLLKCSRLARLAGSEEIQKWIGFEIGGYNSTDPISKAYMYKTGRWTNHEKNLGYWGPLAQQEASIQAMKQKIEAMKLPSLSGEYIGVATNNILANLTATTSAVSQLSGIQSRVMGILHKFVSSVYYEREFSNLAESVFDRHKKEVDLLIADQASDVLQKLPAVIDRLREGDPESVSQALTTCRRILESFADAIYPPTEATIDINGNTLSLDASKQQNRISAYIADRTKSASRRKRLRQNLANMFDRVSTGVHNDVTAEEAMSLFLNVYLFLGEVLQLPPPSAPATSSAFDVAATENPPVELTSETTIAPEGTAVAGDRAS